jgi:hypothetical protein
MGHSIQVHLSAYAKFQPDGLAIAYAQANRLLRRLNHFSLSLIAGQQV